jgi:glutathione S-transferase
MITLYHCIAARSFRPLWALEEMELDYRLQVLPFPPRVHAKHYLAINPLGTVPALIDGATELTESVAICHYLALAHGPTPLAVDAGDPACGAYLNWLHFGESTLTFPLTIVLRYGSFEPDERKQPQAVADYRRWFLGRLRTLEPLLAQQAFVCADRFTMADISVGYALVLAEIMGLHDELPPAIQAYLARLKSRDGYQRACAAELRAAAAQGVSTTPAPLALP